MDKDDGLFDIYVVTFPGLEHTLCAELRDLGFADPVPGKGGVTVRGGWPEVWRINLEARGANRVLARVAEFRAFHLAQLDKRARRVDWAGILRTDAPVHVEASCTGSRIYHAGAAAQRIGRAIRETLGTPAAQDAEVRIKARIDDDLCTISIDTSGESLHKRGHKEAVNKAPMRETMAALLLRECGYTGTEPVIDPMCGSGTFVIEAAEIAAGLKPGRSRHFAFQRLATFDPAAWERLRAAAGERRSTTLHFVGSDRDAGAVAMSRANAERAGIGDLAEFRHHAISDLVPPEGPPGLVIVNPPYGTRIGTAKELRPLYHAFGDTLRARFSGWRVGLVTSDPSLAAATGLPFAPPGPPVNHGGVRVSLYRSGPLP